MDILHRLSKWIDYNRYAAMMVVLTLGMSVWLVGCPATTMSVLRPDKKITAQQLDREAITIQAHVKEELAALK